MEPDPGNQPIDPIALQRPHRRHDLHGRGQRVPGTAAGARYFERLVEEMEYKAANGIGTSIEEKYRLLFVGVPCYPIFRRFNELFTDWGGTFVNSTYLWFASGGTNRGFEYDLSNPLSSLAEGVLVSVRQAMDAMFHQNEVLVDMVRDFSADGVIYHPIKSLPHRVHRSRRRTPLPDREARHPQPVHRVGHDGSAGGLRSTDEEPGRRFLRGPGLALAPGRRGNEG